MVRPRFARAHRRGIASIWTLFMVVALFLFIAMAVDVLWTVLCVRQLSAGADASALAGALYVRESQSSARDKAVAFAAANTAGNDAIQVARNDANAPAGDVVIGRYNRDTASFTATTTSPNAVLVRAKRTAGSLTGPLPMIFASITGVNSTNVDRHAIAMIGGGIGGGIIALDPTAACAIDMRGSSGNMQVLNGFIVVDSNSSNAACRSGHPTVDTEELHVVGNIESGFANSVTGEVYTDRDYVPDPLAALPEPNLPAINRGNVTVNGNSNITLQPGRYGNITIRNGNVTMQPGLYYVTGNWTQTGGNVNGTAGVSVFIGPAGSIDIAGNGQLRLVGMSPTTYPDGPSVPSSVSAVKVPIFQSRSNTRSLTINGTNNWLIEGTIYAPSATMLLRGSNGTFANGLIADQIHTRGTADLVINYQGQFEPIPPFVFLVE